MYSIESGMRLNEYEKNTILAAVKAVDPEARIYLFGSRTDDTKKGGDIDVLIFSNIISFQDKLNIKTQIFEHLEEQKIDLLVAKDVSDPFVKMAFENSQELL